MHRRHLRAGDQQAGNYAGEIERADRGRDQPAPDDHQDRRRDDHRQHRRDRGDGDREGEVVALPGLRIDEDLGSATGGIGRRGSGNTGEEDRQHDVDLREPSRGNAADHACATSVISRSVMPPTFIRFAVSRKKGTASRMKELYALNVSWASAPSGRQSRSSKSPAPAGRRGRERRPPARAAISSVKKAPNRIAGRLGWSKQCIAAHQAWLAP